MKIDARRWAERLLWLVAVLLVLATLIPILDSNAWWIRNLTFPQAQITGALVVLFSRLPLADARVEHLVDDYVPSIRATVTLPSGRSFVFHGLHPRPPMEHGSAKGDADLVRAGTEIAREKRPALLTGDLNDVPWASTTQLFGQVSGMGDVRVGRGFIASFDANSRFMRWPLDHVFVTPGFRVSALRRLPDIGSDHFPMLADLCLTGRDAAPHAGDAAWRRARQVIHAGEAHAR